MNQMIYVLLLSTLLVFTVGCKEEKKTVPAAYDKNTTTLINIHGKTDKRLKLQFYVSYRPKYFPKGKVTDECTEALLHPLTATKRRNVIHSAGAVVEKQNDYNITFPIFNKILHDKCTSTPVGISVRITRLHEKHGLYSIVPIFTDTPSSIGSGTRRSMSGGGDMKVAYRVEALEKTGDVAEPPKYFRVRDGAVVRCFTRRYGAHHVYKTRTKEMLVYQCELPYKGNAEWRDVIKDDSIRLDIIVDENKSSFLQRYDRKKVIGKKEPFQEEKLNWYDKIKLWIKGE